MIRLLNWAWLVLGCVGCGASTPASMPSVSSSIAITSDDRALWVANAESDSVSVIDPDARTLVAEIPLGVTPPMVDPTTHRYDPGLRPRALAILPDDRKVYVAAQAASTVFVVDAKSHAVTASVAVAADPVSVVAAHDGRAVYVVSSQAATVTKIDPASDTAVGSLSVGQHPWGASLSADGKLLYVSQLLLEPGVTVIDTATFTVRNVVPLAEQSPDPAGKLVPNGLARGVYAGVPRPGAGDVWIPHLLLATKTPEPDLDFQSTVFPTVSTVSADGMSEGPRLLFAPLATGTPGAFIDVVSGPRAVAFTPDGKTALVANANSEDVLVFDADQQTELGLVRPLPSAYLEGIVVDHVGKHAYVDGRNTHDVTVLAIDRTQAATPVVVDGPPIERLANGDPMPANLRQGQRLFFSANSAAFPLTRNFWVACASCHVEGGTDAVTWLFLVGPRDTPSNAGGPINTGFLLRQALRSTILDYDTTINLEQGGTFHRMDGAQRPELQALADFVNFAIPFPANPNLAADGTVSPAAQHGQQLFSQNCAKCHSGSYFTDSGSGNPTLDLNGPILLHNIGTCVTSGAFPDEPAADDEFGHAHTACDFDTPTLRSIFATAPYFHDGSAATLRDVVDRLPFASALSDSDRNDLVEYLKTL
jgi:YVTN family beta-propeller protein